MGFFFVKIDFKGVIGFMGIRTVLMCALSIKKRFSNMGHILNFFKPTIFLGGGGRFEAKNCIKYE